MYHITYLLRAEQGHRSISSAYGGEQTTSHTCWGQNKATGASAVHMVENRPHHTHPEGRTRLQEHQQCIWWRTDHIMHNLRAEQAHRSISSAYGGEQTTSRTHYAQITWILVCYFPGTWNTYILSSVCFVLACHFCSNQGEYILSTRLKDAFMLVESRFPERTTHHLNTA